MKKKEVKKVVILKMPDALRERERERERELLFNERPN